MLIGYVSDEDYMALAEVCLDFEREGELVASTRSTATGAVLTELPPATYRVTLTRVGYGSKRVLLTLPLESPYAFRLLSDRLLGYVAPKWVKSGELGEFRVHSIHPYHLSLWRYGAKKERVRPIGWFDAHGARSVMQITPDGDYTQTGVAWNKVGWESAHHTQFVPAPERSGLYYFHAKTDRGEFFSFPWVVAPRTPHAKIAVLASTNNWNAYNAFGGRSNYVNSTGLPATPTVNVRQDLRRYGGGAFNEWSAPDSEYLPLSFDRPERINHIPEGTEANHPIEGRDACHVAPAEWRLLAWLEREEFGYDLYAEHQLHTGQFPLEAYSVLILSTHPEYWSRAMYNRMKQWVFEQGGRLVYLGGNGLNCEVEIRENDTMICYTEIPVGGYEGRFQRRYESEANLLGVAFTEAGIMTAAPYRVCRADHWVFEHTGLQNGDLFGEECLHERIPGGASGHETDKINPFSPPQTVLLAKGENPDEGGAEMTCYELSNGGACFSVGSITYPASLLVDASVSQITRNVLTRFLQES
jgi:hypothetical protein